MCARVFFFFIVKALLLSFDVMALLHKSLKVDIEATLSSIWVFIYFMLLVFYVGIFVNHFGQILAVQIFEMPFAFGSFIAF